MLLWKRHGMITESELFSLLPIALLAGFYLLSNVLFCNRLRMVGRWPGLTRTQGTTVFVLYPTWVALTWVQNLATVRGDLSVLIAAGVVSTITGWAAGVAVFNDEFRASRQQLASFVPTLVINGLWLWNNYIVFSQTEGC